MLPLYANAEVEPTFARSPSNPQQLVAAWQQCRVSSGNRFLPRALLSGTDFNNRNDAYLLPVTSGNTLAAAASTAAVPVQALSQAEFQTRRNAFTQRVMEQRLPD